MFKVFVFEEWFSISFFKFKNLFKILYKILIKQIWSRYYVHWLSQVSEFCSNQKCSTRQYVRNVAKDLIKEWVKDIACII